MPVESLALTAAAFSLVYGGILIFYCENNIGKYLIDRKVRLAIKNSPKPPIALEQSVFIDHDPFKIALSRCFRVGVRSGGVSVLGGPCGSGKSTYIDKYIPLLARETGVDVVFLKVDREFLSDSGLHSYLGIPKNKRISEYIPKGTTIILDQCDLKHRDIAPEMQEYITDLATDGRNSGSFHVIISVSDSDLFADVVLNQNYGQKITQLCLPSVMKWSQKQIKRYIDESLPKWSLNDREKFADLFKGKQSFPGAESHGPVRDALQVIEIENICRYEDLDKAIHDQIRISMVNSSKSWWKFFMAELKLVGN